MDQNFQQDLDYSDIKIRKTQLPYSTKTKGGLLRFLIMIAVVIIGVILVISLISKSLLLSKLQEELASKELSAKIIRDERKNVTDELNALKEENNLISHSIIGLVQTKSQLTSTVATLEKENESLARDVIGYNQDFILSQKELKDLTQVNDGLTSQIEQLMTLNSGLEKQIKDLSIPGSQLHA